MPIILYFIIAFLILLAILVLVSFWQRRQHAQRENFINTFTFPPRIREQLMKIYPHLSADQADNIIGGLRTYFHLCRAAGPRRMVAMPSQAVDVAWHEFILFTRVYDNFCRQSLGYFLHHTPAEAMNSPTDAQKGIKTAWRLACQRENMNPKHPAYVPGLFAMDALCAIPDGFHYVLDCQKTPLTNLSAPTRPAGSASMAYCVSHIGCSSGGCGGIGGCGGCGGIGKSDGGGGDAGGGCGGD